AVLPTGRRVGPRGWGGAGRRCRQRCATWARAWCGRDRGHAMARIRLTVLVRDTWRDRYPQVVEHCRQAGLAVERELVAVGVIVGSIEEELLVAVSRVEGVSAVEPERANRALESPDRPA